MNEADSIFLFTENERRYFQRINKAIDSVLSREEYTTIDADGKPCGIIYEASLADIKKTLEGQRYSIESIARKAKKKTTCPYFLVGYPWDEAEKKRGELMELYTNTNPTIGQEIPATNAIYTLTLAENPTREQEAAYRIAQREALGLGSEYRYFDAALFAAVKAIDGITSMLLGTATAKKETLSLVPSASNGAANSLHAIKKPSKYLIGNSKPYNMLGIVLPVGKLTGQLEVRLYKDAETKTDVIAYMALSYKGEDIHLRGRQAITGFDRAVYNTISSLYSAGNTDVTAQDIFRTMNFTTGSPSQAQIDRIGISIRKFMYTGLYLNISDDIEHSNFTLDDDRITKGIIETQLLQATICEVVTANKRKAVAYKIDREPIMLTYNKAKHHILKIPLALLDTSKAVSNTEDNIAIREYLLQQIELIKSGKRNNPTIRYDTITNETAITPPATRTEANRQRAQIKAMLDVWIDKGHIRGYTDAKKGNAITGVTIIIDSESAETLPR